MWVYFTTDKNKVNYTSALESLELTKYVPMYTEKNRKYT
jgi:hypothetical protein